MAATTKKSAAKSKNGATPPIEADPKELLEQYRDMLLEPTDQEHVAVLLQ